MRLDGDLNKLHINTHIGMYATARERKEGSRRQIKADKTIIWLVVDS